MYNHVILLAQNAYLLIRNTPERHGSISTKWTEILEDYFIET